VRVRAQLWNNLPLTIPPSILHQFRIVEPTIELSLNYQGHMIRHVGLVHLKDYQQSGFIESQINWNEQKIAIVLPTYNEKDNLPPLLEVLHKHLPQAKLIIVDDASPDGTGELADSLALKNPSIMVHHRTSKLGLGTAYIEGFRRALDAEYDVIVQMHSDFSHDPAMVSQLIENLSQADLVIGSRYVMGGGTANWSIFRKILSQGGSVYARTILGLPYQDITGGFKVWKASALKRVLANAIHAKGYAFQLEMTYRAHQTGLRILEIPIHFEDRRFGKSKMSLSIAWEAMTICWRLLFCCPPNHKLAN
jgi:dolichol-phosphate mannosyltransferase